MPSTGHLTDHKDTARLLSRQLGLEELRANGHTLGRSHILLPWPRIYFLFFLVSVSDPAAVPVGPTSIVRSYRINHRVLAPLLYNNVLPRSSRTPILSRSKILIIACSQNTTSWSLSAM